MSVSPDQVRIAAKVLHLIEVNWQSFSVPTNEERAAEMGRSWARVMARFSWPEAVWVEAVDMALAEATSRSRPPMPGDLIRHGRAVMERIEADPSRADGLRRWREERRARRDAWLEQVHKGS